MTPTDFIASVSISISLAATLGCLILVPVIIQKGSSIQSELQNGMDEFNVLVNEAWSEIVTTRTHEQPAKSRNVRQLAYGEYYATRHTRTCTCEHYSTCPPGLPGPEGLPGVDGEPGNSGISGRKGSPGVVPPHILEREKGPCRQCPNGPKGRPGPEGPRGARGEKGRPGVNGSTGRPGYAGATGSIGSEGPQGLPGTSGDKGYPGRDAVQFTKGPQGMKGYPGPEGSQGQWGERGADGQSGARGSQGSAGPEGEPGAQGSIGPSGISGPPGRPGKDAQYCACPKRLFSKLSVHSTQSLKTDNTGKSWRCNFEKK